jgi:hypothetical protein
LVLVLASSAFALEKKAYQMREDFGTEPIYDGTIGYYYYVPCPTYAWFWSYTGWVPGEIIGEFFTIGDQATGAAIGDVLDPLNCHSMEIIRILDFAGYGVVYPGRYTVEFDVYCAEENCGTAVPLESIWNSGPFETAFAWNYIYIDPPLCLTYCGEDGPTFVVTATMTGTDGIYPAWGMDNISTSLEVGMTEICPMHDYGCVPALYPRYACGSGMTPAVHGGYIGTFPFQYWPPQAFLDGRDTTPDGSMFGAIELAWKCYIACLGPTATEPSSWGNIKSMYR